MPPIACGARNKVESSSLRKVRSQVDPTMSHEKEIQLAYIVTYRSRLPVPKDINP